MSSTCHAAELEYDYDRLSLQYRLCIVAHLARKLDLFLKPRELQFSRRKALRVIQPALSHATDYEYNTDRIEAGGKRQRCKGENEIEKREPPAVEDRDIAKAASISRCKQTRPENN